MACEQRDQDRYGRMVAVCYAAEERAARRERIGIWAGAFTPPETWRRKGYQIGGSMLNHIVEPSWVVVITKPMAEEIAERSLRQAGFRVYLPRYRKEMRPHGSARRGKPSMRPLFAGYLFVQDWNGWPDDPINGTIGLMKSAARNVEIAETDIVRIIDSERAGEFDEMPSPRSRRAKRTDLTVGDTVEMDLLGVRVLGVLDDLSESGKAIVRAMMFNREVIYRDIDDRELSVVAS